MLPAEKYFINTQLTVDLMNVNGHGREYEIARWKKNGNGIKVSDGNGSGLGMGVTEMGGI